MARQTRSQRRARREAQQASGGSGGGVVQRAQQRQAAVRPAAQQVKSQGGGQPRRRGSFARESWGELKKVEWPGQRQVMTGTVVVLIACVIVGIFLFIADAAFEPLVERVFLGQ